MEVQMRIYGVWESTNPINGEGFSNFIQGSPVITPWKTVKLYFNGVNKKLAILENKFLLQPLSIHADFRTKTS